MYGDLDFTKQCSVDIDEVTEENVFNEFVNNSKYPTAYKVSSILSYNTAKISFQDYEAIDGYYGNEARIVEKDFQYYRFILLNPKVGVDSDDELNEMDKCDEFDSDDFFKREKKVMMMMMMIPNINIGVL